MFWKGRKVEEIYVTRSTIPEYSEYVDEIKSIWNSHILTNMGPKHQELQKGLEQYLGVDQIELLTNGHMALELSLQALELPVGGEVITTPFTFASTTHAIVRNGLIPVFCDIKQDDYTIDPEKIENLIKPGKTVAIVPVHVYGNVCDIEAIQRIADKYELKVLYDAAHSFGETYKGKGIGTFGDVSCFSFHATKVFNSIEGGAVCHCDSEFGRRLYRLKNFGIRDEVTVDGVGANAKMNEFCAAMGICNLRHIDEMIAKRKTIVNHYRQRLSNIKGIRLCPIQKNVESNYSYMPVVFDKENQNASRDEVYDALKQENIYARKYFYPLTSEFDCYKGKFDSSETPVAKEISESVLTLPLYPDLRIEDVDKICDIVESVESGAYLLGRY